MFETKIFQRLADYASLNNDDVVLDIGAGLGFLTSFLAHKCKKVLAVELDSRLVKVLLERLKCFQNVDIIEGDVFKVNLPAFTKVVSIPPYKISSALLEWLSNKNFSCAVLVLQKEFADRIVAPIGSENYSWLTVFVHYLFEAELLDNVSQKFFYPQPKVDSMIVRLKPISPPSFKLKDVAFFKRLIQTLFTQRNRKIRNAVQPLLKGQFATREEVVKVAESLPFRNRRVRELAPEDFGELANVLAK